MDMITARKMKMKDSFNTLFPTYTHGRHSTTKDHSSKAHDDWVYPKTDLLGNPTHIVDKELFHKNDEIKEYAVGKAAIMSIWRIYKA